MFSSKYCQSLKHQHFAHQQSTYDLSDTQDDLSVIFCGKHPLHLTMIQVSDEGPLGPLVFLKTLGSMDVEAYVADAIKSSEIFCMLITKIKYTAVSAKQTKAS